MKLRIYNSSLRFRLNQTEVNQLLLGQEIKTEIFFPTGRFAFSLVPSDEIFAAELRDDCIHVYIPHALRERLANEEQGLDTVVENGTNEGLRVLVEKDYGCEKHKPETPDRVSHVC